MVFVIIHNYYRDKLFHGEIPFIDQIWALFLSFTFMMGECGQETQSNSQVATITPSTKVTVNATAIKTQVIVDTTPPVININIVNTTSRSGVQTTNKEEVTLWLTQIKWGHLP